MKILQVPTRSGMGQILVGRDARSNDELTINVAKANDLWFHASDEPGAHVVLQNSTETNDIIQAADLAYQYSKSKTGLVSYCFAHQVSKQKYASVGQVIMNGNITTIKCGFQ